jgi:glycosyltransferase involved in cell wall biosynthesis
MTAGRLQSILYDARTVQPGMTGVGRYAYNLLAALARQPGRPALRALFLPASLPLARQDAALAGVEPIEAPASHEDHPRGDLWLRYGLPRLVRPGELYHGPAFLIPGGRHPFPRVVTIHDLFVFTDPAAYPLPFRLWLRRAIHRACRWADRIIVPTRAVGQAVKRLRLAPAEKIAAIPYAPDATPEIWESPTDQLEIFNNDSEASPETPRLLSIGTLDPRKDPQTARLALMLYHEAHPDSPLQWVWAGGGGARPDPTPPTLVERAASLGFHALGPRPNVALRRALTEASAYVTCSRAEGFGIPLTEALAAGCPIVASDLPVHREVAGNAALYFPAGDAAGLARVLHRLLTDPARQAVLRERARRRGRRFDWSSAAARTLALYRQTAAAMPPPAK